METSHFNELAGELRNNIWELVMHQPEAVQVDIGQKHPTYDPPHYDVAVDGLPNHGRRLRAALITGDEEESVSGAQNYHIKILGLAQTCRQIRSESIPIFCSSNTFRVETGFFSLSAYNSLYGFAYYRRAVLESWLRSLVTTNNLCLGHVEVDLGSLRGILPQLHEVTSTDIWDGIISITRLFDTATTKITARLALTYDFRQTVEVELPLYDAETAVKNIERKIDIDGRNSYGFVSRDWLACKKLLRELGEHLRGTYNPLDAFDVLPDETLVLR